MVVGEALHVPEEARESRAEGLDDLLGKVGRKAKRGNGYGLIGSHHTVPSGSSIGFDGGAEEFASGRAPVEDRFKIAGEDNRLRLDPGRGTCAAEPNALFFIIREERIGKEVGDGGLHVMAHLKLHHRDDELKGG